MQRSNKHIRTYHQEILNITLSYFLQSLIHQIWKMFNLRNTKSVVLHLSCSKSWANRLLCKSSTFCQDYGTIFWVAVLFRIHSAQWTHLLNPFSPTGQNGNRVTTQKLAHAQGWWAVNIVKLEFTFFVFSSSKFPLNCQPQCCFSWTEAILATQNSPLYKSVSSSILSKDWTKPFLFTYLFIFGHAMGMRDLRFLTRDWTHNPHRGSAES